MSSEDNNPYEIEGEMLDNSLEGVDDAVVRSRFIREEVCVVAVGWFYYCMGAFQLTMTAGVFLFVDFDQAYLVELGVAILVVTGVVFIITGYGMRHFIEWARKPSLVAAVVGMCMFPVGTLAGIYCLVLLRKSAVEEIFTERYRLMVARENYRSMGWLAFVTGVLMAVTFWGLFFFLDSYGVDWELVKEHFSMKSLN